MPGLLALIEGDLPSGRYRARELVGCCGVSALASSCRRGSRRTSRPRRAASAATTCGCSSPTRHDATLDHARFRDLPSFLAPGRPARRQHVGDAAGRAARDARRRRPARAAPLDPAPDATTTSGSSSCGSATAAVRAARRSASGSRCPAARSAELLAPLRRERPPRRRAARPRRRRCSDYLAGTGGRSATATSPTSWPLDALPDRLRARARQRRDAERRTAVHARADHAARRPRRPRRAGHAAHRRLLAGAATSAPTPSATASPRDGAARQRRPRLGRARDRDRDDRRARARDRRRSPTAR